MHGNVNSTAFFPQTKTDALLSRVYREGFIKWKVNGTIDTFKKSHYLYFHCLKYNLKTISFLSEENDLY